MTDLEKVLNSIPDHVIKEAMQNSIGALYCTHFTYDEVLAMDLDTLLKHYCNLFQLSSYTAADIKRRLT